MHPQTLIAHAKVLATAIVAAIVGAGTTLVGQGVPDPHTQGTVAFIFAAFTWVAGIIHRWETSPADAKKQAEGDFAKLLRDEVLPMVAQFLSASVAARTPPQEETTPPLGTSRRSS